MGIVIAHPVLEGAGRAALRRGVWLFAAIGFSLAPASRAANMTPVAVSGFNRDVVIENTASGPPYNSAALNFNAGENTAYYQSGLPGGNYGLPVSGTFTSAVDGTVFQFQPYTANNALVLSSDTGLTSGTLTLTTPATYSRIAVIANSGNGNSVDATNVTLQFTDGGTLTSTYIAPDWFFNTTNVALQGVDRINLSTGGTSGGPTDPRFYQTTLNLYALLGASNRPLASLTFAKPAAKSTGIYAVSGFLASAVALAVVTNTSASNVQATTATVGGQVISTGGEPPAITLYYGPANGGANPVAWSNSVVLGYQTGAFAVSLSGLAPNTSYYFTVRAVNYAGTTWAAPAGAFTTVNATPPALANLPATSITAGSARLEGQVLATGGDAPTVTLYYGPVNGGTNAAAWVESLNLGLQAGKFAQLVFGLSSNTTYYFTAKAANYAATVWAAPSQMFTAAAAVPAPAAMLTHHNDLARTGANLSESILNVNNVNPNQFGLLYTRPVDDQIYAQPLVLTNVNLPAKGIHNVVYVCTVNDTVYAFDSDDPSVSAPYWQISFIGVFGSTNFVPPRNTDMTGACGGNYQDFSGNIGIVSTPVIDPATQTIYLLARTKETTASTTNFVQRLHALDVRTGAERPGSPTVIAATCPGTGSGSVGGVITFDPQRQNQRAGLTLVNGRIYLAWASHCDWGPYHGWLMAYDAATLQRVALYNDTPNGSDGGIWMSGQAPSADANGNIYIMTGNGTVGTSGNPADPINRGESFLKLNGATLAIMSWFTPWNWSTLEAEDRDLGSGGPLLIPGTTLTFGGGKEGKVYLLNRDNLGGLSGAAGADTNAVQSFQVTPPDTVVPQDNLHGSPTWWDGPDGSYSYIQGESDYLRQYQFDRALGMFASTNSYAQSPTAAPIGGMPGGMIAVSANGTNAGTGIVWASHQYSGNANQQTRPGILHAYNAENVSLELWNSELVSGRDSVGNFAKFCPPTIVNGKVYLATFSNRLNVYGLLPRPSLAVALSGGSALISWSTNYAAGYILQTSTNLVSGTWVNVTNAVLTTNGLFEVTIPPAGPASFYRLQK